MRTDFGRMVRSAMLTPWFAVSAGIVIAASLTLARPHPALTFPHPKSGRCIYAGCASPSPAPSGRVPAIKHEVRLPQPNGPPKVEYKLLRRNHDHFMAVILIIGHRSLNNWRLRFVMRGAAIYDIWGATAWRPDGHGGVIVSGSPSPWQKSGDNEARIIVFGTRGTGGTGGTAGAGHTGGTWTPARPTGCEFGNLPCSFRALPEEAGHSLSRQVHHEPGSRQSWRHQSADQIFGD
jgi:hypothetical protein